ncbi:MAG: CDP-diacylglycerol--glycerol-3-phosphate 3-phosphatidyltransferase [Planctomycetota bacterium]
MLPRRQIPNAITLARLVLTAVCIACLSLVDVSTGTTQPWLGLGLIAFLVAALTDWLDGALARRWNVVSRFGRVMDPLADKVLVLGTFIVLAGPGLALSGVHPWMVVVMLTRELLVTGLRSAMESCGNAFGAVMLGKAKMVLQSVAIVAVLAMLWAYPPGNQAGSLLVARDLLLYLTVAVTVLSAWPYVAAALRARP